MDERHTRERSASLGSALQRLSAAREQRGPVDVLDPFDVEVPREDVAPQRANARRGLFSFSGRARDAVEPQ